MSTFRVVPGTFSVAAANTSFSETEQVKLRIKCQVERVDGLGAVFSWVTSYSIYTKAGKLVKTIEKQHSIAPWTSLDTANDDFEVEIGLFTPGTLEGYVQVKARD
jgi:hypothetical protein